MRELAGALVIDTEGRLLLQQRDDIPTIICPGMIGLFGGHREGEESFLECAVREIAEELSCSVPPERFHHLLWHEGPDPDDESKLCRCEFFVIRDIQLGAVTVTEGTLLAVKPQDLAAITNRCTPMTRLVLDTFLQRQT
jgi:8-oxo-dGTP diphosphatase